MPPKLIDSKIFDQDTIKTKIASRIQQLKINEIANGEGSEEKERLKMSEHIFKKICKTAKQNPAKEAVNELTEMKARYVQMQLEREIMEEERAQVAGSNEGRIISDHANNMLSMIYKDEIKRELFAHKIRNNIIIQEYIDKQLTYAIVSMCPSKLRFLGHVGLEVLRTEDDYKKWIRRQQMMQQQPQQQPEQQQQQPEPQHQEVHSEENQ